MKKYLFSFLIAIFIIISLVSCSFINENDDKIDISKLSLSTINEYEFNGKEIFPTFTLSTGEDEIVIDTTNKHDKDFNWQITDNLNAGIAKITLSAKTDSKSFKGTLFSTFTINKAGNYTAKSFEDLMIRVNEGNVVGAYYNSSDILIIEDDVIFNIPKDVKINLNCKQIILKGKINNAGELVVFSSIINYGSLNNTGILRAFDQDIPLYSNTTTDTTTGSWENIQVYNLIDIASERVKIVQKSIPEYNGKAHYPTFNIFIDDEAIETSLDYENYKDNINAGVGSVTLKARSDDKWLFGSITVNFSIARTTANISFIDKIYATMPDGYKLIDSPNYSTIILNSSTYHTISNLELPIDKTLIVKNNNFTSNSSTIFGKLIIDGSNQIDAPLNIEGELIIKGTTTFNSEIKNNGKIIVDSQGIIYNLAKIEGNGIIENNGAIYTNFNLSNVKNSETASYNLRREITVDEVSIENDGTIYNGMQQQAKLKFSDTDIKSSDYSIKYSINDIDTNSIVDANTYRITITFNKYDEKYLGTLSLDYKITKALNIIVTNDEEFIIAVVKRNYHNILVKGKINTNYFFIDKEMSLEIYPNSQIIANWCNVGGTLINNGQIFFSSVTISDDGKFINNSEFVTNNEIPNNLINNGQVYLRVHISEVIYEGFLNKLPCVYGSTEQPNLVLKTTNDISLICGSEADYTMTYSNNVTTKSSAATVKFEACPSSKYVYGYSTKIFSLSRGEAIINTLEQMLDALNRPYDFHTVSLGCDIDNTNGSANTIEVHSDTILDMRNYIFKPHYEGIYNNDKLINNGTIYTSGGWKDISLDRIYSGNGKVILYTDSLKVISEMDNCYHEIKITADIIDTTYAYISFYGNINTTKKITIDLQGHTITRTTKDYVFICQFSSGDIYIISTNSSSTIGDEDYKQQAKSAILAHGNINEDYKLHISSDVKFYGLSLNNFTKIEMIDYSKSSDLCA